MACGARSGLKPGLNAFTVALSACWNGLWGPFGIETFQPEGYSIFPLRWNGLWGPFGIETPCDQSNTSGGTELEWLVGPVRD